MPPQSPFNEEDTALLNLYLSPGVALTAICEELEITYSELERRLNQPHIKEAIERATRLHEQRAQTLARCRAEDAVATLNYLAGQPEIDSETRRKAASQLLRTATAHVSNRPMATATVRERAQPTPRQSREPHPANDSERTVATPNASEGIPTTATVRQRRIGERTARPTHTPRHKSEAHPTTTTPVRERTAQKDTLSPPHRLTHSPSHPRDASPALAPPNIRTYNLHPFTHPHPP